MNRLAHDVDDGFFHAGDTSHMPTDAERESARQGIAAARARLAQADDPPPSLPLDEDPGYPPTEDVATGGLL